MTSARKPRRRTAPANNPTPTEWKELPPNTPYGGKNRYQGVVVGRTSDAVVTNLATPSRLRPREGQLWVGPPVGGHAARKSTVRNRLRRQQERDQRCSCGIAPGDVEQVVHEYEASVGRRDHIPSPPGVEFPHRKGAGIGCRFHPVWQDLQEAVAIAQEGGAEGPELAAALRHHPDWATWIDQEARAMKALGDRDKARRRRRAHDSAQRETLRRKREFVRAGGDVTDASWTETLRKSEKKRAKLYGLTTHRANPSKAYFWWAGGVCCAHNHPSINGALACARAKKIIGRVEIRER